MVELRFDSSPFVEHSVEQLLSITMHLGHGTLPSFMQIHVKLDPDFHPSELINMTDLKGRLRSLAESIMHW